MTFKNFTLASIKAWTFFGLLVAILSGLVTIYSSNVFQSDAPDPRFIGRWTSEYTYPVTDGVFSFKGATEYFQNGNYNVSGVIAVEGAVDGSAYSFSYRVNGAGTWKASADLLSFVLLDMKSIPKEYVIDGERIPTLLIAKVMGTATPNLEDIYVSGSTGELALVKVDNDVMILQGKGPLGEPFTIRTTRQL